MSEHITYVANGGQTYQPCQDNVKVPFASYEKPAKPNPLLPELELNQDAIPPRLRTFPHLTIIRFCDCKVCQNRSCKRKRILPCSIP